MILSPQVWPRMAVAYLTGGMKKEALYATNAAHSGFRKEDVDDTFKSNEWHAFIDRLLNTGGEQKTINEINQAPTTKQITEAAMTALRLQTINELSKLMSMPMAADEITKALSVARAMVEDKAPPPKIDINNGVIVQMVPRREAVGRDRNLQTIEAENTIEKLIGNGSTKKDATRPSE